MVALRCASDKHLLLLFLKGKFDVYSALQSLSDEEIGTVHLIESELRNKTKINQEVYEDVRSTVEGASSNVH